MKVKDLLDKIKDLDLEADIVMVMDWTRPETNPPVSSNIQWSDAAQDIYEAKSGTVVIINRNSY